MAKEKTVELCVAGDEIEARSIASLLSSEDVDCVVVPYQDTAYPGVADRERPWGVIRVGETDLTRAKELLETWKEAEPEDLEEAWQRAPASHTDDGAKKPGWQGTPVLIAGLIVLAVLIYFVTTFIWN